MMNTRMTRLALKAGALVALTAVTVQAAQNPRGPAVKEAGSVTFRSMGEIKALMFTIQRDRSITLTPILQNGKLMAVKVKIVDHAEGDKLHEGMMKVDPEGRVSSDDPAIVNACNLLNITPRILAQLKTAPQPVVTMGATEVSGVVHPTRSEHSRLGNPGANGLMEIKSLTRDKDGLIDLETITMMGPDGLPVESKSKGTIKKGLLTLTADLKTIRIRDEVASGE